MKQEDFYAWEDMGLLHITHLMVKWFGFSNVTFEISDRPSVESRIWYRLEIEKEGQQKGFVDGQRVDIVKRRLIEFLDRDHIRDTYLQQKSKPLNHEQS